MLCLRFAHLVRQACRSDSAMDARLDTGGWLALTRQGLSPCKRRQAYLGAITLAVSRRALNDVLEPQAAIGAVGSTALFGQAPASCVPDSGMPRVPIGSPRPPGRGPTAVS